MKRLLFLLLIPALALATYTPQNNRGQMSVVVDTEVDYAATNTYEKIIGTWTNGCENHFTVDDTNDRLIYTGPSGVCFLFVGSSEVSISNASTIYYALYLNGALVPGAETEHSFASPAKTSSIAICKIVTLDNGDYMEVWTKCDGLYTLTIKALTICFWGER